MYRPFITCGDTKGVVECGTIRRCKGRSEKMEQKIESHKKQKNSGTSLSSSKAEKEDMVPRRIAEECCNPSSFHLVEVSKGTQKLNRVIESWPSRLSYDSQHRNIAKDVLKGALDLQESLIMFGKLQEASKYMAQLKKMQKDKTGRGRSDEMENGRTNSIRPGNQIYGMGLQKPQLSADWSSGDCVEELRKAIRDSLVGKSLPNGTTKETIDFRRGKLSSNCDASSSSTSQLSAVQSDNIQSPDSSISPTASQKKVKSPNLIAKLMGLEDIPAMPVKPTSQKKLDENKYRSLGRPVFDNEMPKPRKPEAGIHKIEHEQRKLKEMLEKMQLKKLLKSCSVNELTSHSQQSSDSKSKERLFDTTRPIVLIKPLSVSCLESEEALPPMLVEKGVLTTDVMLGKMKVKERLAPESIKHPKGSLNCSNKRFTPEEGAKEHIQVAVKPKEIRDVKPSDQKDEALMANRLDRTLEADVSLKKRLSQEVGYKDQKEVADRKKEEQVETNLKSNFKMKAASPHQQQRSETARKKVDKIEKNLANNRKPEQNQSIRRKHVPRSQDQANVTSTKLQKPVNGSMMTKNGIPREKRTSPKTILRRTTQAGSSSCKDQERNEMLVDELRSAEVATENSGGKEDDMWNHVNVILNDNSSPEGTKSMFVDYLTEENEVDASKIQSKEHCSNNNVALLNSQYDKDATPVSSKDAGDQTNHNTGTDDNANFQTESSLKAFLLSSPLFLTLAGESTHVNGLKTLAASCICDFQPNNIKLYLNYVNEFIECRTASDSPVRHPLLPTNTKGNLRICASLDQLADEICDGIETLSGYSTHTENNLCSASLFAILGKDIVCKKVVSGVWDVGWNNVFSVEEAEEAVTDIERLLLGDLIEELLA